MMHDRLREKVIEAPAIEPLASDDADVEQRIGLRAADGSPARPARMRILAQSAVSSASIDREKWTRPATVGPSPVIIPRHTSASAAAPRKVTSGVGLAISA